MAERVIIGIDPGTSVMGFGIIKIIDKHVELIDLGVIKMNKISDPYLKLKEIFSEVTLLLERFCPDELSIEAPFYGKNVQSMLKLGRAQGVAIAAALQRDIPIFEYAPRKIKMAITGRGSASKEQVAGILKNILKFDIDIKNYDATDAVATALCHYYQKKSLTTKSYGSWSDYVKKNPGRKA